MRIGSVETKNPVVLAPMAGVSEKPFRIIAAEMGCGLLCTEMISDNALVFGNRKTMKMLEFTEKERPLSMQIFGSDPAMMAEAAKIVSEVGPDIIDINMGCPTPKIVRNGEGSHLMREPLLAAKIIRSVVNAVDIPVTVKMRLGWDAGSINVVEIAKIAEEEGASAVAVHARTREQFYSGTADWSWIKRVKENLRIPVIGNGDITTPESAHEMMRTTGCDGVMIGRAARGNPWIFQRTVRYLSTGVVPSQPKIEEIIAMAIRHAEMHVEFKGEEKGIVEMRKHISWYLKGLRGAPRIREEIHRINRLADLKEVLLRYLDELSTCKVQ